MGAFGYAAPVNKDEKKVQDEERAKIRQGIESCWKDKIAISWCTDDVIARGEEYGKTITEEEALDVLNSLMDNFDANLGINWYVIDEWI